MNNPMGNFVGRKSNLLSIILPVLNEQDSIEIWLDAATPHIQSALKLMGPKTGYELVFVDDGSTDASLAVLAQARLRHPEIRIVVLSRNFGKDAALSAGMAHARGDAVIPMDVDLQDPPEVIPKLVAEWLSGAQVVNAVRVDRTQDSLAKRATASAFYWAYNRMADRPISPHVGDFRLIDRSVLNVLKDLPERTRFMKGLVTWVGFRTANVPFTRAARANGTSKWNYWKLWNFALDGITASTTTPLRIWTYVGLTFAMLSFLYAAYVVAATLLFGADTPGYASLITVVLLLGGLNLISLGVLGEYIGRISTEVKGRPLYVVAATIGQDAKVDMQTPLEAVEWS